MNIFEILNMSKFNKLTVESYNSKIKNQNVNYGNLFISNLEDKLSVIAKYNPPNEYITLNKMLQPITVDDAEFYYGVSPKLDSSLIIKSISELRFSNEEALDLFISEHNNFYMLHKEQEEYLLHIARYITLAFASNYGIVFKEDKRLTQILDSLGYNLHSVSQTYIDSKTNQQMLTIKGCPSQKLLSELNKYKYRMANNIWEICDTEGGMNIYEVYANKSNIQLINGEVFYSGVLLKPIFLSVFDNVFENVGTKTLCFYFEKTTYATVFALDWNFVDHPILNEASKKCIIKFLNKDDEVKEKLLKDLNDSYGIDAIEKINIYLKNTYNVNQIGVSANIVTKDGILLLGKRSSKSIDNSSLYPSVNGNAEVEDSAVSFYNYSVYEDFPTLNLDKQRLDFLGEITREAYAELKLDINKQDWTCLGVTISGTYPPVDTNNDSKEHNVYCVDKRRMHFNILFETVSNLDYSDIVKNSSKAEEKFENSSFLGLRINSSENVFSNIIHSIRKNIPKLLDSKDFIDALLLLLAVFIGMYIAVDEFNIAFVDIISIILAILIIGIYIMRVAGWIKRLLKLNKTISKTTVYLKDTIESNTQKIDKKIQKYKCHPVTYMLIKLYVYNSLVNLINDKSSQKKFGFFDKHSK